VTCGSCAVTRLPGLAAGAHWSTHKAGKASMLFNVDVKYSKIIGMFTLEEPGDSQIF
jgi:hypothetical protein